MKKLLLFTFSYLSVSLFAQQKTEFFPLIPQPNEIIRKEGFFIFNPQTQIVLKDSALKNDVNLFNEYLLRYYGYRLAVASSIPEVGNYIEFGIQYWDKEVELKEDYIL